MTAVVEAEGAGEWDWGGGAEMVMMRLLKGWNPQGTPLTNPAESLLGQRDEAPNCSCFNQNFL